jgi:hypothetical protein
MLQKKTTENRNAPISPPIPAKKPPACQPPIRPAISITTIAIWQMISRDFEKNLRIFILL